MIGSRPRWTVLSLTVALSCAVLPAVLNGQATATARQLAELTGDAPPPHGIWVEDVGLDAMFQRRGRPVAGGVRVGRRGVQPITLGGVAYTHGIGTQSISEFLVDLKGQATRFQAMVGLDDAARLPEASVDFVVYGDDRLLFKTDTIRPGDPPRFVDVDLTGVHVLTLLLDDAQDTSNGDLGVWAGATILMRPGATEKPVPYVPPAEPDPAIATRAKLGPEIHGPLIVGATPGRPFLYRIPVVGLPPMRFEAKDLPAGLELDAASGIIHGVLRAAGRSVVTLTATAGTGSTTRQLTIVGGDHELALTPPMGWNSWNSWGRSVGDAKVRAAADAMVSSGLAAHGYRYIVIDDGWVGRRDADGVIHPDSAKFPDMKALADYVHAKGLQLGIYSSPGPRTCQGLPGSYQHEAADAKTWAAWGVDYLKYDHCSYDRVDPDRSPAALRKPYDLMRKELDGVDRDIVYSISEYGWGDVWKWGRSAGVNLWRTTGDLLDSWANLESVGFRQAGRGKYAGPGHWNDTDMLVVGDVGWGPNLHPTRLTKNEQVLHLTLWAIQAAPLMIGADLSRLDPWTVALLTNDEVLDVTNDTLGIAGDRISKDGRTEVWARPLADGTHAVALFNRGLVTHRVTVRWSDFGIHGSQPVRDLWKHEDLGAFTDTFSAEVPSHGAVFVKVGKARR